MSRAKNEAGIGLVELLIALTILSIGIFALVAGFSSGFGAINRSSKATTAATLAEKKMEAFRRMPYSDVEAIALVPTPPPADEVGPDGRTYSTLAVVEEKCPDGAPVPATPPCMVGGVAADPVMFVTITVTDGSSSEPGPTLFKQTSTFHESTG